LAIIGEQLTAWPPTKGRGDDAVCCLFAIWMLHLVFVPLIILDGKVRLVHLQADYVSFFVCFLNGRTLNFYLRGVKNENGLAFFVYCLFSLYPLPLPLSFP
jgi:hypothetical protein